MRLLTIRSVLNFIAILLLSIFVVICILKLDVNKVKVIATDLNTFSNLILALLTSVLVGITAFYAVVTNRTLAEMKVARQSKVRPVLWVSVDKPEFKASKHPDDNDKYFCTKVYVSNFGEEGAINIQVQNTIPHQWSDEYKCVMPISSVGNGDIPSVLRLSSSFDITVRIPTKTYNIEDIYPKYLTVRVLYEDKERNLYQMNQSYYLLPAPPTDHYLHLETESLHFVPLRDRTNVTDNSEGLSSKGISVFNRQKLWKWNRDIQRTAINSTKLTPR